MKVTLAGLVAGILAAAAAPTQVAEADWATQFLLEYGWLGLFVLSGLFNIYQYRKIDKMKDAFDVQLKEARDELVAEYKTRIDQLWKQAQGS